MSEGVMPIAATYGEWLSVVAGGRASGSNGNAK